MESSMSADEEFYSLELKLGDVPITVALLTNKDLDSTYINDNIVTITDQKHNIVMIISRDSSSSLKQELKEVIKEVLKEQLGEQHD
jgi:hypothetical protein